MKHDVNMIFYMVKQNFISGFMKHPLRNNMET